MPESFLRATWRRSLRVKRSKSLVIEEKRKSDSFVNSQEWTLSRDVPDLRLGIVGSLSSCKSALVHRYLTGSYMQEESPEGGRFKKEIMVDGKSYLLLIRDEGGPPEQQFTAWVDAVIFVFSVENESSFNAIYTYYSQMAHFRKSADIPFILVGTQDAICETNPRVIDESRARKLATDLKRCTYWETCATYGLHVERVFEEACQKIVQQRNVKAAASCVTPTGSRPSTPNTAFSPVPGGGPARHLATAAAAQHSPTNNGFASPGGAIAESPSHNQSLTLKCVVASSPVRHSHTLSSVGHPLRQQDSNKMEPSGAGSPTASLPADNNNVSPKFPPPAALVASPDLMPPPQTPRDKDLPTPSSTPTTARKSRRKSNLFTQKKSDDRIRNCYELGIGRDIPLKQGFLSKRSSTSLNKEFKKKYVTIMGDGVLSYHPSINDYIAEKDGKDITLQTASVKIPGQMPCTYKTAAKEAAKATALAANPAPPSNGVSDELAALSIKGYNNKDKRATDKVLLTAYDLIKEPTGMQQSADETATADANSFNLANGAEAKLETPSVKKRHRRIKSSGVKHGDGEDSDREFVIMSMAKQWHFMASDTAERDEWVTAIEEQILRSIQAIESSKAKSGVMNCADTKAAVQYIRTEVAGNAYCADCDAPNPEWASLNLGVLVCIQCSGTHRNLGSHISRVRSLQLDDWPLSHTSVMIVLGNALANSVWEADTGGRAKPTPDSSQEEKERWIRDKYEGKQFLAPPPSLSLVNSLYEAVRRSDMKLLVQCLAHCTVEQVNHRLNKADGRAPIHFACENADLATVQLLIWNNASVTILDDREHTLLQCTSLAFISARDRTTVPTVARDQALMALLRSNGCLDMAAHLTPNFNKKRPQAAPLRPGAHHGSAM